MNAPAAIPTVNPNALPAAQDRPVRSPFEEYRDGLVHDWTKTLTALGFCLIPVFFLLDLLTMPRELLPQFLVYRSAGTIFALAQLLVVRRTRPSRYSFLHGYAFSLMVGGMIVRMTVDLGGFNSAYYAGLILVIIAVNLVLPWRALHSAVNGLLVVGSYVAVNSGAGGEFATSTLINNLYFLISTVVITVAISYLKHRLIEQEFNLRAELLDVNAHLDRSRRELKAARDALWGEMEVAKRIQTALLPRNRTLGHYAVAAVMRPADEVGGDYYDLIETRAGEAWVTIGDVSGHGVESGLVMMMTQTSILTLVNDTPGRKPSEVFAAVNGIIRENIERMGTSRYMTLNVIRLLPDRLTLAGKHQDILVHRRRTRQVEVISNEGSWVGIVPDTRGCVDDSEIPLEPGDTVLLFTDGVTEAMSASGEMFDQDRLVNAFARVADQPLELALAALLTEVNAFQQIQQDDVTLMLLRRE